MKKYKYEGGFTLIEVMIVIAIVGILAALVLSCMGSDARVVSHNISKAADQFEINRRVVFYNGINGEYILSVEGLCSIVKDRLDDQLECTCKTGPNTYKKHYLGISDNVTYFAEQLEPADVSSYRYKVIFKPSVIVPDINIE